MPEIKTKHKDILRLRDVNDMLELVHTLALTNKPALYTFNDKQGNPHEEELILHYGMTEALVCLLYLFGKRISEVLQLTRGDIWTKQGYMYIRFHILKKKSRTALLLPVSKVKRVSIKAQEPLVIPILSYANQLTDMHMPLFPGHSRPHTIIVKRKDKETGKIIKTYKYEMKREGFMSRQHAYKILKALNPEAYPHWFRHSLATELAEQGFNPHELKDWFDWSRYETASSYVEGMPAMTQRISKRKLV